MAAEQGKVDPMHQFSIHPMFGTESWEIAGYSIPFTNSALWMVISAMALLIFVGGGLKRELVPGRWQMAVETFTGFIDSMLAANIGPAGKKYVPYIFSLFMFILFAN
ncbi:MAG TPA: F0F1 ATP synthase subunit A, partial [Novosphingobium sp.]|nr:F0F1 ATP synthase subunit A [Novosphingobium sp.]